MQKIRINKQCFIAVISLVVLGVSGCSSSHNPAPVVDIKTQVPLHQRKKGTLNQASYQVKKGETLYSIAWRANTDVKTLARINHLAPPYKIVAGQKIFLSEKSAKFSNHKGYEKNQNNSSGLTSKKVHKKAVDQSKKQAYGETATEEKTNKNSVTTAKRYSMKIRHWQWPHKGRVIEGFSTALQGNKGINIEGKRGSKVVAAADGKVVYAGDALRGYGNLIIIKHNDDYLSAYAHNDKIMVQEQQHVKAGDVIATMGDTDANRVMLHFEVRFRGKSVNPLKYLPRK